MFAVSFYDENQGTTFWGDGETPQDCWDNLLADNALDPEDVDIHEVTWYKVARTLPLRRAKLEWVDAEDLDD
jgi:hypothetical protein